MTIPPFEPSGNLPPGIHMASWDEIVGRYGATPQRLQLLQGLKLALDDLKAADCRTVYIDGSFVTETAVPGDFDACWEMSGVDVAKLNPVLLTFDSGRATQKARNAGELFPAEYQAEPQGTRFIDFFQRDKNTGSPKGIIQVDMKGLP